MQTRKQGPVPVVIERSRKNAQLRRHRRVASFIDKGTFLAKETFFHHPPGIRGPGFVGGPIVRDRNEELSDPAEWSNGASADRLERRYYATDWQGRVVSLVTAAGVKAEDYRYSATGVPFGIPLGDINADGKVDGGTTGADYTLAFDQEDGGVYDARVDLNLDGTLTPLDDVAMVAGQDGVATGRNLVLMTVFPARFSSSSSEGLSSIKSLGSPGGPFYEMDEDGLCPIWDPGYWDTLPRLDPSCGPSLPRIRPWLHDDVIRKIYWRWCRLLKQRGKTCPPIKCKNEDPGTRGVYYEGDTLYLGVNDDGILNNIPDVLNTMRHELLHALQYEMMGPMSSCEDRLGREYDAYSIEAGKCPDVPNRGPNWMSRNECLCRAACASVIHDTYTCYFAMCPTKYLIVPNFIPVPPLSPMRMPSLPLVIPYGHMGRLECCVTRCLLFVAPGRPFPL